MISTSPADILARFNRAEANRGNWHLLWDDVAELMLPARADFVSQRSEGSDRTTRIYDSTAINAAQTLASSIHGAITMPTSRWFNLGFRSAPAVDRDAKMWLDDARERLLAIFHESNFASQIGQVYLDLVAFGTSGLLVEGGLDEYGTFCVYFDAVPLRGLFILENRYGIVDTTFYKSTRTARQIMQRWPDVQAPTVKQAIEREPETAFTSIHCVMPHDDPEYRRHQRGATLAYDRRPWQSYWLLPEGEVLSQDGYYEMPYLVPRWNKLSTEAYGFGPGLTAAPDVRTLNEAKRLELAAWEKNLDPPMLGESNGVFGDVHMQSGGFTSVRRTDSIKALHNPTNWQAVQIKSEELRQAIERIFLIDKLRMPERPNATATEIQVRYEEMQRVLGPTMGRLQTELLNPLIERVFGLALRAGVIPPPPESAGGMDVDIEYRGPVARTQRIDEAVATERWMTALSGLQNITQSPEAFDWVDIDRATVILAERYGVPPAAVRAEDEVKKLRTARQAEQERRRGIEDAMLKQQIARGELENAEIANEAVS